jgi:hypothetical protein
VGLSGGGVDDDLVAFGEAVEYLGGHATSESWVGLAEHDGGVVVVDVLDLGTGGGDGSEGAVAFDAGDGVEGDLDALVGRDQGGGSAKTDSEIVNELGVEQRLLKP